MEFTCTIKEYETLNKMRLEEMTDLKIDFSFAWEDGRVTEKKARVVFFGFDDDFRGAALCSSENGKDQYSIVINSNLTEEEQRHTLKHEIEHIAYRDFESTVSIGVIEAIRHSAIGNQIKKEYRSIDSMKEGV